FLAGIHLAASAVLADGREPGSAPLILPPRFRRRPTGDLLGSHAVRFWVAADGTDDKLRLFIVVHVIDAASDVLDFRDAGGQGVLLGRQGIAYNLDERAVGAQEEDDVAFLVGAALAVEQ